MSLILIFLYSLLVTLTDLLSAVLYAHNPLSEGIAVLRYSRDGLMVLLALWGIFHAWRAGKVFTLAVLYVGFIAAYGVIATDDVDMLLLVGSAVKLALPVMLVAAGYGALRTPGRLQAYAVFAAGLAMVSTLFGAWDIRHTDFWVETVQYGHYLNGIKGIVTGFDWYYVLPFNFFGYEYARRAAGLVAAPLAQGSFVAVGAMLGFAALQRKSFGLALLVLLVGMVGVWQSGTRGAMLVLVIALPVFLVLSGRGGAGFRNFAVLFGLLLGSYEGLQFVLSYTVNLQDGSTIGHVEALQKNITDLPQVILFGPGLGASGALAADLGLELAGGGEGAIFAITYQLGVPAALVFLLWYGVITRRCIATFRQHSATVTGDLALACGALSIGMVTTFISSDHLFSLSGLGLFWIVLGGVMAQYTAPVVGATSDETVGQEVAA
ncbi:hypothetical protein [Insolitispirillum peregrinum]|uniref:D-xylose transport system permease protein n=1 Tax=Insolitispirillum peregrinum TaxID=80876 RepID=A0A1N7LKR5_9PROT|nr:hypothetical protein [Insolitispirillum peregrinum]SIS74384.1 D-xylose transport system permease protein [Insolitispirillum peregrinum]